MRATQDQLQRVMYEWTMVDDGCSGMTVCSKSSGRAGQFLDGVDPFSTLSATGAADAG